MSIRPKKKKHDIRELPSMSHAAAQGANMRCKDLSGFGPVGTNGGQPSAAAIKAAQVIGVDYKGYVTDYHISVARIIDAELSAERKAAEEMSKKLQDVKAACMYHGFSDIPRQIDATLAAYEAARKG